MENKKMENKSRRKALIGTVIVVIAIILLLVGMAFWKNNNKQDNPAMSQEEILEKTITVSLAGMPYRLAALPRGNVILVEEGLQNLGKSASKLMKEVRGWLREPEGHAWMQEAGIGSQGEPTVKVVSKIPERTPSTSESLEGAKPYKVGDPSEGDPDELAEKGDGYMPNILFPTSPARFSPGGDNIVVSPELPSTKELTPSLEGVKYEEYPTKKPNTNPGGDNVFYPDPYDPNLNLPSFPAPSPPGEGVDKEPPLFVRTQPAGSGQDSQINTQSLQNLLDSYHEATGKKVMHLMAPEGKVVWRGQFLDPEKREAEFAQVKDELAGLAQKLASGEESVDNFYKGRFLLNYHKYQDSDDIGKPLGLENIQLTPGN